MNNADVAAVFDEIADLLEIKGADAFRVNSYRKVARTVGDLPADINAVAERGELEKLPGVGKSSAAKIKELLETGRVAAREDLLREVPETVLELLKIQGVGPKTVSLLWRERSIASLAELKQAIESGALEGLKGLGKKSIDHIKQGVAFLEGSSGRRRLGVALEIAERLRGVVRAMHGVRRVEIAGSLRRGKESVGDIDLLCVADDGATIVKAFTELTGVEQVLAAGDTKGSVLYEYRPRRTIQIDLRVIPEASFGAAWQYFTGSKEHNVRLREMAVKRGWSLNEYGLTEGERVIAAREEIDVYKALELPWFPPETREDRFEFEWENVPRDLLTVKHIRGDLHMHTSASDGINTIAQMVEEAERLGYEYICITDHSKSSVIANGLDEKRLRQHMDAVREVARKVKGVEVLMGTEVDILAGGKLDYSNKLLAELDFVVASLHTHKGADVKENTKRTVGAIENPYVNVIGHPTARLINRRPPMGLDIEAVCQAAAETGTALEINASDLRLDLKDTHARLARDMGAVISINTDAHATHDFRQMVFGVMTARRAGLLKDDVLNTWPLKRIREFVSKKRER